MWQIILCVGFAFLILEMFTPSMFFLNFAIAAFICALLSLLTSNLTILIVTFSILSVVLMFTLRPLLMKKAEDKKLNTGMESKYVGKIAKAIEDIDKNKGAISIYDERWQARNVGDGVIEAGAQVEIVSYDSLIIQVRKL